MLIAIDALPLLVRSAGVKNYLYYWIRELQRQSGGDTIRLFPPLGEMGALDHQRSAVSPLRTFAGLASLALMNHAHLPLADWLAGDCDVFHTTNLLHSPPRRKRLSTTVHDMTTWLMPDLHTPGNQRVDRHFERTIRRADGILADSESTRSDIVRLLGIDDRKISVVHLGVAEPFFAVTAAEAKAARAAYGITRPFALFLSTIEPRKNVATLLDAWERMPASAREEFDLIIAGPAGWAEAALLARLHHPMPGVRYLGYVAESHLPGLTAAASLFVYPSLYEGFGLPVAQAMAAGVPVVTSNVSSIPEITGDASVLVDPRSVSELSAAMARLLLSPTERAGLAQAGRERVRKFTWAECARKSLDFFHALV